MRRIKSEHLLPGFEDFEVYVDSPLSVEATNVFHKNNAVCFNEEAKELIAQGINPIRFEGLKTSVTSDESKSINFIKKPIVILSASGMCEAGRIRHHLKHNLWRKDSTIIFVGFQVPGTLGNFLLNGAKQVRLFGETVEVNAKILNLPGISGFQICRELKQKSAIPVLAAYPLGRRVCGKCAEVFYRAWGRYDYRCVCRASAPGIWL